MRVDIIDRMKAFVELRRNWEAVYDADPEAQFFLSWTFLSGHLPTVANDWFILAAKPDSDSSDYVAFFPLRLRTLENEGGGFCNDVNLAGNYAADYTGFICRPESEEQAIPLLANRLKQLNWRQLRLENMMMSERRFELFIKRFAKHDFGFEEIHRVNPDGTDNSICPFVTLPGDWDSYLDSKLSANTRQKIRRLLRQFDKSDEFRITHATKETIERDVGILFRFWAEKWGPRKGKRLPTILKSNRTLLTNACASGSLFMPVLWQGERPLGVLGTLVDVRKKAFHFLIGARDETFNSPPPGVILHAHSIRHAIANGFTEYDFLRGNEPYKYSFGTEERRIKSLYVRTKDGKNLGNKLDRRCLPHVFRRATELHKANQLVAAERAYKQILQVEPNSKGALYGLGQLVAKRGDHFAAKRLFKSLVAIDPNAFKTWYRLGRSLVARGELSEAAEAYCEVIEREPKFVNAYYDLGHVLLNLGLATQATAAFEAALGLKPDYTEAAAGRGKALQVRGQVPAKQASRKAKSNADIVERFAGLRSIAIAAERYHGKADANRILAKGVLVPYDVVGHEAMTEAPPARLPN